MSEKRSAPRRKPHRTEAYKKGEAQMEDPRINSPPADRLDSELTMLLNRIAAEPVSPALAARARELHQALEAAGMLKPGQTDRG